MPLTRGGLARKISLNLETRSETLGRGMMVSGQEQSRGKRGEGRQRHALRACALTYIHMSGAEAIILSSEEAIAPKPYTKKGDHRYSAVV